MKKDIIQKFLAHNGQISITCINSTKLVEEARNIHDLTPTTTATLGRLLTIGSLMGADLKSKEDSITIQIKGDGPVEGISVVVNSVPQIKAYIKNPIVELPLKENGKIDVGGAIGHSGFINVIKDIGLKEPYIGMSPIISGEIAEDFANYFLTSEQKPTAVALGVLVDKNGVKSSGGYILTALPDATDETISIIEKSIKNAKSISTMLEENTSLEDIAKIISLDNNLKKLEEEFYPEYKCNCSKEKIEKGLISLGKSELEDIINEDEKALIKCQFCKKEYEFNKSDLEKLIKQIN